MTFSAKQPGAEQDATFATVSYARHTTFLSKDAEFLVTDAAKFSFAAGMQVGQYRGADIFQRQQCQVDLRRRALFHFEGNRCT
jgi:hypothetical protein